MTIFHGILFHDAIGEFIWFIILLGMKKHALFEAY